MKTPYVATIRRLYGDAAADEALRYYTDGGKTPRCLRQFVENKQKRRDAVVFRNYEPQTALVRPRGLSKTWKPSSGGTL